MKRKRTKAERKKLLQSAGVNTSGAAGMLHAFQGRSRVWGGGRRKARDAREHVRESAAS